MSFRREIRSECILRHFSFPFWAVEIRFVEQNGEKLSTVQTKMNEINWRRHDRVLVITSGQHCLLLLLVEWLPLSFFICVVSLDLSVVGSKGISAMCKVAATSDPMSSMHLSSVQPSRTQLSFHSIRFFWLLTFIFLDVFFDRYILTTPQKQTFQFSTKWRHVHLRQTEASFTAHPRNNSLRTFQPLIHLTGAFTEHVSVYFLLFFPWQPLRSLVSSEIHRISC